MIFDKYSRLIEYISSCNGTGRQELQKRVDAGEVSSDDAESVFVYACLHKINAQLDNLVDKVEATD